MDLMVNSIERTIQNSALTERECDQLGKDLTLGNDKRLAAMARSQIQIGRLILQELHRSVMHRSELEGQRE